MNHGSLFSGGGGFDLAAEAVGWNNVFHCEKDPFCRTILNYYWPHAKTIEDIKALDGKKYKGKIDIITGGFPCQPFSAAGKRRGTSDDRYLWPEMLRVIREIQPRWVVGENVYGLVSWDEGLVFHQVQLDLEAEGYEVAAYVLPASGINAPHQRYRVWFVAYNAKYGTKRRTKTHTHTGSPGRFGTYFSRHTEERRDSGQCKHPDSVCKTQLAEADTYTNGDGFDRLHSKDEKHTGEARKHAQCNPEQVGGHAANAYSKRPKLEAENGQMERGRPDQYTTNNYWRDWPTQSPICGGDDGLPTELHGIAFPKWKSSSLKMFGNAIVPQMAIQLFEAIKAFEAA